MSVGLTAWYLTAKAISREIEIRNTGSGQIAKHKLFMPLAAIAGWSRFYRFL
jgi:hypothetical protein